MFTVQFYEADEKHKKQEAELKSRLQELEKDSEQHQAIVDGLTTKYMDTIERLQGDKARLEVGMITTRNRMVIMFTLSFKVYFKLSVHAHFFAGEGTDAREGNKRVSSANRRVVRPVLALSYCC